MSDAKDQLRIQKVCEQKSHVLSVFCLQYYLCSDLCIGSSDTWLCCATSTRAPVVILGVAVDLLQWRL